MNAVQAVRRFNRFYTNILGLIDRHLLQSPYSLEEVRVLYEIGHAGSCTAKDLKRILSIDGGYLSRILKKLEKGGLVMRTQNAEDGRVFALHLTAQGKAELSALESKSDEQIGGLLRHLSDDQQGEIASDMQSIEKLLGGRDKAAREDIRIRTELRAGDAGYLSYLQSKLYYDEYGYGFLFESYVCRTFYECLEHYDPAKDRFWILEHGGRIIGSIAILERSADRAQLRWLILHPDYRGLGLGKELVGLAVSYCREKGYKTVFLETTDLHEAAISLYRKAGFVKIAERPSGAFGRPMVEETYELAL